MKKIKKIGWNKLLLLFLSLPLLNSCSYYSQAIKGHFQIMGKTRPIAEMLQDPNIEPKFKQRLKLTQKIRTFAVTALKLPDNDSYKQYADIGRDTVTWGVIATPEFSVEPKKWCFAVVGCLSYHGYFNKREAELEGNRLRRQGFDVEVAGSPAYSTLGWFSDPILNTVVHDSEARVAEIIFHELTHQKLYISGDTGFNEAFAVAVARHGVKKWFTHKGDHQSIEKYHLQNQRRSEFRQLMLKTRQGLRQLYSANFTEAELRRRKNKIFEQMRANYRKLKTHWKGYAGYDKWMSQNLNNAHLSLIATYHELVPPFLGLIDKCGNNLPRFYRQVEQWKEMKPEQRKTHLLNSDCSNRS